MWSAVADLLGVYAFRVPKPRVVATQPLPPGVLPALLPGVFLKCSKRRKDGKEHRSWSVVESRRLGRHVVQRHVLYRGEINDSQQAAWQKAIAVFDEQDGQSRQCALFPEDRTPPDTPTPAVHVRLDSVATLPPPRLGRLLAGRSTLARAAKAPIGKRCSAS